MKVWLAGYSRGHGELTRRGSLAILTHALLLGARKLVGLPAPPLTIPRRRLATRGGRWRSGCPSARGAIASALDWAPTRRAKLGAAPLLNPQPPPAWGTRADSLRVLVSVEPRPYLP